MEQTFKKNLAALASTDPALKHALEGVESNIRFSVDMVSGAAHDIQITDQHAAAALYGGSPAADIARTLETFGRFARYPYLYVFGLGNGGLFGELLHNSAHRRIVVYEPEIEIVYIALHLNDFSGAFESGRLRIVLPAAYDFYAAFRLFRDEEVKLYCKTYDLSIALPYYERYYSELVEINQLNIRAIHHVVRLMGNDPTDMFIGIRQHVMHLFDMIRTPTAKELFAKAKNTETAVIVATGPSLSKQLELLKRHRDRVSIISVDASLPILERNGIKPDVVVSMERVVLTSEFFKRTSQAFQEGIVCALSSLQHPEVIQNARPECRQISMRPFNFMKFFGLHEWGYIGVGMSSANMAFELAFMAQFKRTILIGQDLAYSEEGLSHAKAHVFGEDEVKAKEQDLEVEKYGGGGTIRTTPIWNSFRQTFETHIAQTKEQMSTYNATEGGARINGAIEKPFAALMEEYASAGPKKRAVSLAVPSAEQVRSAERTIAQKLVEMLEFLASHQATLRQLFLDISEALEAVDRGETLPLERFFALSKRIESFREAMREERFEAIFQDVQQSSINIQELDIMKLSVLPRSGDEEERNWQIEWMRAHQGWTFMFAGLMENYRHAVLTGLAYNGRLDAIEALGVEVGDKAALRDEVRRIYSNDESGR